LIEFVMTKDRQATAATFDPLRGFTGRDGAVDDAAKTEVLGSAGIGDPVDCLREADDRFALALGNAVIAGWAQLAREDQERLFELAVSAGRVGGRNEVLREDLAKFLHDHHERTAPPRR
jgi:hypothetical protein